MPPTSKLPSDIWRDPIQCYSTMPKVQVTLPDGSVTAVDLSNIELGDHAVLKSDLSKYYTQSKDQFEEKIQERLASVADNAVKNPDIISKVLKLKGIKVDDNGDPIRTPADSDLDTLVAEQVRLKEESLIKEKITPLEQQLSELTETSGKSEAVAKTLSDQVKILEIERAAQRAGVAEGKFKVLPGAPRDTAPVIAQTKHLFDFDDNHNLVQLDETGKAFRKGDGGKLVDPESYFKELSGNEELRGDWFPVTKPNEGAPVGTGSKGSPDDTGGNPDENDPKTRMERLRGLQTFNNL